MLIKSGNTCYYLTMKVVIIRKRVKTLTIRIIDGDNITVTVPLDMSNNSIEKILNLKSQWIENKLKEKKELHKKNKSIYAFKEVLLYGNKYEIAFSDVPNVCCVENYIILPNSKAGAPEEIKKTLDLYLSQLAKNVLPKYVATWGEKMSLCPTAIKIKNLKSKWGSCNGDGEIVLNVKLIHLPIRLIEYVVVHELCHLKNLNHSELFWKSVKVYFPDLEDVRKQLHQYDFLTDLK